MGLDASQLAASVAKSAEIGRSPGETQRATEITQRQLAAESASALERKRTDATEHIRREKIRQEREKRRRQMERHEMHSDKKAISDEDGPTLDLVA